MPKVTQYQPNQVSTNVVNQPRANAASGVAVFQSNINAMQGAASLAGEVADTVQRVDTTSAEEALVQFERDKNKLFFDPDSGYFNTQGKNAYDNAGGVTQSLNELKKRYGDKLNPNAQSLFNRSADAHLINSQKDIDRHASKGLKAWEVSTIGAQVENSIENSALYWNQPEQLGVQKALGRQAVIDAGQLEGIGAEALNERLQTFESSFAESIIETATMHNSELGRQALNTHGDRLEGALRKKLKIGIDKKIEAEDTAMKAEMAVSTGASLADMYDSRSDIMKEIKRIRDPEHRKRVTTEAMRQFNIKKQIESEERGEAFESAESHILEGGSAETFKASNPEQWNKLTAKQKTNIESGKAISTDWSTYSDLMLLPKSELAKIDPTNHFHELGSSERKSLVNAVKSAGGKGLGSQKADYQIGRTRNAQITSSIEQMWGKKSKWNDDEFKQVNAFYDLLDSEVQHLESQKNAPLTSQEFTDVLSNMTRKAVTERSFIFDFVVPDKEEDLTDIPPEDMRELSQHLRDNNKAVTIENLLKLHKQVSE